jgi:cytochrome c
LDSSDKGQALYEIYCISCHEVPGNGKGKLQREISEFLAIKDRVITEGSFHVVTYLNAMDLMHQTAPMLLTDVLKLKSQL